MRIKPFMLLATLVFVMLSCEDKVEKNIATAKIDKTAWKADKARMNAKIDSLLSVMTIEEKIGQLNLPGSGNIVTGQTKSTGVIKKIEEGKVGGLFSIRGVEKIRTVQKIAVEKTRLGIPLIIGMDVIHGFESTFPIPLGLASCWDMEMIEKTAKVAATEASADGINWTFSPMVDISRDPRWGRIAEGSGEDPYLGGEIAKAMVRGYQQDDLSKNNTLMSCVKHFALYGAPDAGRDYNTVDMSKIRMYNEYLHPYKAGVEAGAGSMMASFNEIDGIPATGNKWLLTDLLRTDWGFDGFVVTDYTGVNEMVDHGMGDLQTVSALALKAGSDMDMIGEGFLTTLKKSLDEDKVTINDIDTAVRRLLEAKYQLGLFDDPYRYLDENRAKTEIFTDENRDFARKVATESMVLLKNEGNILPIKRSSKIALIGPLANNAVNMGGTWDVNTDHKACITVLDGIKTVIQEKPLDGANKSNNALGSSSKILYAKGSNLDYDLEFEKNATMFGREIPRDGRTDKQLRDEAVKVATQADVIVAVIGEAAEMSGESSSRTNIEIPQAQKDLLHALQKTGKPIVLVLFAGRPMAIKEESQNIPAILNVWFPGSEAGLAISDVLFGDVNPSGKLTATFPQNVGQVPIYYNAKNTGRPLQNTEGKFEKFRSNYIDERNEPLYPFGYGLSYTTFDYSDLQLSSPTMAQNGSIDVSVKVKNSGNYDGKEVVQLYIRDLVGSVTRPLKELKGFQKIALKKGETKTVTFKISVEDLKFYNSNLDFVAEEGDFEVFVGTNSVDVLKSKFTLTK